LHLTPDSLSYTPASGEVTFPFDPAVPPTFPGGPLLFGGGYADDTSVARREDVFAVASSPLGRALEVHGRPTVVLDHVAKCPDSNVFVRLSEVDARGKSRNVTQGAQRTKENGTVRIELNPIAHRFRAGNRIRIAIAGGAYPHFPSSPGTGENPMLAARQIPNQHTIRLAGSSIDLPVGLA
jgi:putative CocE/NonD family hydrolase